MSDKNSNLLRVLGVILLVVIILGAGAAAFMAGQAQGYRMSAYSNANPSAQIEPGTAPAYPYYYPHMMGRHWGYFPFMGFMGFGGIFGFLFVGLLIFFLVRWIFFPFRGRYWNGDYPPRHWHGHHHWHGPYDEEGPEEPEKPAEQAKS